MDGRCVEEWIEWKQTSQVMTFGRMNLSLDGE